MLPTNRGLIKYYLLTIITLGIYPLYFIHRVAVELNTACSVDGKRTRGLIELILFTILTFGIYSIFWWVFSAQRMSDHCVRNGFNARINGASYLLWCTIGCLLFCLGPIIAEYKYIHTLNDVNMIYNTKTLKKSC